MASSRFADCPGGGCGYGLLPKEEAQREIACWAPLVDEGEHGFPVLQAAETPSRAETRHLREPEATCGEEISPYRDTSKRDDQILCRSRATPWRREVMREARALPGPPARALSDDPRRCTRAADPKPILSRSQAPTHLPRANTEQTAMDTEGEAGL